jgi:hypothetical protein
MWLDLIVEYATGFAFGLFIFQSLFMKNMMGGTYFENVKKSFMPEFISMNAMMVGMAPVMTLLMMGRDMRAMEPTKLIFWGVMSFGVITGFFVAYPVNVWMVSRQIKHGLMTERKAPNVGEKQPSEHDGHAMASMGGAASSMAGAAHDHASMSAKAGGGASEHSGHGGGHAMKPMVTRPQVAAVTMTTTLMLLAGMTAPSLFVNMRLSARDVQGAVMPPGMILGNSPTSTVIAPGFVSRQHLI